MHDLKGNPFVSSDGFRAVAKEVGAVTSCFANPRALTGKALMVSGREYEFEWGEPNKEIQLRDGRAGIVMSRCGNYVVVGMHDEKTKVSECRSAVEKIIFYLKQASAQGSGSSWQPYIDHAVTSWMVVKAGGIYAYPSGEMWACSRGFRAEGGEVALIAENLSDPEALAGSEITIAGKTCASLLLRLLLTSCALPRGRASALQAPSSAASAPVRATLRPAPALSTRLPPLLSLSASAPSRYLPVAGEPGKEIYCQNGDTGVCFRLCGNNITGKFMAVAYHDASVEPVACRLALVKVGEYFGARAPSPVPFVGAPACLARPLPPRLRTCRAPSRPSPAACPAPQTREPMGANESAGGGAVHGGDGFVPPRGETFAAWVSL